MQTETHFPKMASVVIGAGPAGLLYAFINRLELLKEKIPNNEWPLVLIDKRESYSRNHRLILDRNEYVNIQNKLNHPHFDAFISFLKKSDFKPVVNELEAYLKQANSNLGVDFLIDDIGEASNQTSLSQLQLKVSNQFQIPEKAPTCLVVADSVNSKLRGELGFNTNLKKGTHEHLVRIKI